MALNEKNIGQLEASGLENIKRTLAQNYFTWVVGLRNDQFRFLTGRMALRDWADVLRSLPPYDPGTRLGRLRFLELSIFTRMLWRYAERFDYRDLLRDIPEPDFGNPFPVNFQGRLISQDLANSVLELCSILEAVPVAGDQPLTVCELGAGYGRNAYVFLKAFPKCRYVIVDIPPASMACTSRRLGCGALSGARRMEQFLHLAWTRRKGITAVTGWNFFPRRRSYQGMMPAAAGQGGLGAPALSNVRAGVPGGRVRAAVPEPPRARK